MRSTGDLVIDQLIAVKLRSPNSKARVTLDRYDGSEWINETKFDGESGASWTDSVKRSTYANYGLQPIANKLNTQVINKNGEFSPGSGEAEDNVYDLETRVRINVYYSLGRKSLTDEDGNPLFTEQGEPITQETEYLLYQSAYYLDNVVYNVNNTDIDTVVLGGRDAYKFAIEKDVFIEDLSAGVALDDLVKNICDQVGISYSATSIADLSSFGNRTLASGLDDGVKADKIFSIIMAIINQKDSPGYQMFLEYDDDFDDNILFIQQIPSLYEADFSFGTAEIMQMGAFNKDKNRYLQRMTVVDKNQIPDERELLGSATYTTDGEKTLSLSKNSLFRTYELTINSGSPTVDVVEVTASNIVFDVQSTGSVTVDVYGVGFSTFPTISGEAINANNMENKIGQTARLESLLFESDAEAKLIAEGLVNKFANPDKQANMIEFPYLNIILQTNSMAFPFIRNIFELDLYYVVSIKHQWSYSAEKTTFDLQDSGLNWNDIYQGFVHDSGDSFFSDMLHDIGLRTDMTYGPNATPAQIEALRTKIYDVGEA